MSKSILDNIIVNPAITEESGDSKEYIDIYTSNESIKNIFCDQPGHQNNNSIKEEINTGFGVADSLDLTPCTPLKLHQPLYKENYLSEFKTEDEKRQARLNLGLFDDKDVVGLSLLTTSGPLSDDALSLLSVKSIEQGKVPFAVLTLARAVMVRLAGNTYVNLQQYLDNSGINTDAINKRIDKLINKSEEGSSISTLGDMMSFLTGYKNNDSLTEIINEMKDEYLTFENLGEI